MTMMTKAAADVLAERQRQIRAEGWTPEHDDKQDEEELAKAATVYACPKWFRDWLDVNDVILWPWGPEWFKPADRRNDLIKAGALILAEIERLDRKAEG